MLKQYFRIIVTRAISRSPCIVYNCARAIQNFIDAHKIREAVSSDNPLILIYQYGRVASTSVYTSVLDANLGHPVYHVHTLSADRASKWIQKARQNKEKIDRNIIVGKLLGDIISNSSANPRQTPWKIICIFREPISVIISLHFLNPKGPFAELLAKHGNSCPDRVLKYFQDLFNRDDPAGWLLTRWCDDVFFEETGINVYDYGFNVDQGFAILRENKFEILLLRFEDLTNAFKQGAARFFEKEEQQFNLAHSHIHKSDEYQDVHDYVKLHLKLPIGTCEKIYSTKFFNHFYSKATIEMLVAKWSQ